LDLTPLGVATAWSTRPRSVTCWIPCPGRSSSS